MNGTSQNLPDSNQPAERLGQRNQTSSARRIAYSLRVAQLLGLAGSMHGLIHWPASTSTSGAWTKRAFWCACFVLLITSTLILRWFKGKHPQTASQAIQAADQKWNTPLDEKRAKLWLGCILAVAGAIVLWMSIMLWTM